MSSGIATQDHVRHNLLKNAAAAASKTGAPITPDN
jgi:hypothetical protein